MSWNDYCERKSVGDGLLKKAKFGLTRLPLALGILGAVGVLGFFISGLAVSSEYENKAEQTFNEYIQSEEYKNQKSADYLELDKALENKELSNAEYIGKIDYIDSDEYREKYVYAQPDRKYEALLKSSYNCKVIACMSIPSFAIGIAGICSHIFYFSDEFNDEGYWPWDKQLREKLAKEKEEKMEMKEQEKLKDIGKPEEEELEQAKF